MKLGLRKVILWAALLGWASYAPLSALFFGYKAEDLNGMWIFDAPASRVEMRKQYDDWIVTAGFRSERRSLYVFDAESGVVVKMRDRKTFDSICGFNVASTGVLSLYNCKDDQGKDLDPSAVGRLTIASEQLHVSDGAKYNVRYAKVSNRSAGLTGLKPE